MKIKEIIIAALVIGATMLSSCAGGYTCPTYAQDTESNIPILEKAVPTSEINS